MTVASCSSSTSTQSASSSTADGGSGTGSTSTVEQTVPLGHFEGMKLGASGCSPASPVSGGEVRGTIASGDLYGLIMAQRWPARGGDEVKIVWRMTGAGGLRATLTSPTGNEVAVAWGPEPHTGSNYSRPGDEWGTGYVFNQAGCWHLGLSRDDTSGDVWLVVEP